MKKRILILCALFFSMFLVGCSKTDKEDTTNKKTSNEEDKKLSEEDIINKIIESKEKVNSYRMDNTLKTYKGNTLTDYEFTKTKEVFGEKKELIKAKMFVETVVNSKVSEYIVVMPGGEPKMVYDKRNEESWKNRKMDPTEKYFIKLNYFKLIDLFTNVKDQFKMEEKEESYVFTNKDEAFDIFSNFGDPYNIKITSGNKNDFSSWIRIIFDKKDFRIKSFEFELWTKGKFKMNSRTNFTEVNEAKDDDIKAPGK